MDETEIIKQVEKETKEELKGVLSEDAIGYIHLFEELKQKKLKEKGIEYKSKYENTSGKLID